MHTHARTHARTHAHSPQLREQMEGNAARKAAEQQEDYLAFRTAQKFEAEYKEKVAALLRAEGGASVRQ